MLTFCSVPFLLQLQTARLQEAQVDIVVVEEITDLFIEAGIHLDAVNIEGLTAAQLCVSRKLLESCEISHQHGTFY